MASKFAVVIALLLFALPAHAGPREWVKRHPTATRIIGLGVSAGVHAAGLYSCRTRGVEFCDGKYGASWAIFGAATAANATLQLVGAKVGGKEGAAISATADAVQFGHGIFEWRNHETSDTSKPDLSRITLLHR